MEETLFTEVLVAPWAETESRPMGADGVITWSVDGYLAPMGTFLQDVFDQLDVLLTEVTFERVDPAVTETRKNKTYVLEESLADIEFKSADLIYRGNIGGLAQYQEDDQQWDLLIKKDNKFTEDFKQWLLLHELGHALGLEHPFESSDGDFDTNIEEESVMSYEYVKNTEFFTQMDIDTITGIWNDDRFQETVVEEPSGPPGRRKKSHTHDLKGSLLFN